MLWKHLVEIPNVCRTVVRREPWPFLKGFAASAYLHRFASRFRFIFADELFTCFCKDLRPTRSQALPHQFFMLASVSQLLGKGESISTYVETLDVTQWKSGFQGANLQLSRAGLISVLVRVKHSERTIGHRLESKRSQA
mgnify:CR=1 FL=1